MARFHLAHVIPHPRLHGLNGYREVIESVQWGLEQLGHQVTYGVNRFSNKTTNIIFGAQVLPADIQRQLPANSIIYNFEQLRGEEPEALRPELRDYAARFQIWEYSEFNLDAWAKVAPRFLVKHVPIGYAPVLTRIEKLAMQDIDVLIYGLPSASRLEVFSALSAAGLTSVFVCGLYGSARDGLIARSKLVINATLWGRSRIFEIVRVSYLLANRKAVVARHDANTIEADMLTAVHFSDAAALVKDCEILIEDQGLRVALEGRGFAAFRQRDIKAILQNAL
jgi:hypothetical protein